MRKVALDLGVRKTTLCEIADGKVIARATVEQLSSLEQWLGPSQPAADVVIEACQSAWHAYDLLTEWGNRVYLLDTTRARHIGVGQHGRKTDRLDAEALARALEKGAIPLAHVLSPERREIRQQLRVHSALVASRTEHIARIRGLVRECGQSLPSCDTGVFVRTVKKSKLSARVQVLIGPLLVVVETINAQLEKADLELGRLLEREPVVQRLMTVPAVGPIVAAGFISVIDNAKRFENAHQVESYLGLVPSENSSSDRRRIGSITKKGNSYLRSLLVQAGWVIITSVNKNDPLHLWGKAVAERRGKRIATVAIARRLVGVLWALWRDGNVYAPDALSTATARGYRRVAQTLELQAEVLQTTGRGKKRRIKQFIPNFNPATVTSQQMS